MSIINEDNRLVYDLAFTSKEISIIVAHHHYDHNEKNTTIGRAERHH